MDVPLQVSQRLGISNTEGGAWEPLLLLFYLYLSQKKVSSPANALSCAILAMVAHQASELEAKRASDMPMWRLVLHLAKSVRMIMYSVLIFLP